MNKPMNTYTVKVRSHTTEYYEIDAKTKEKALNNYNDGELKHTKFHGDDVQIVWVNGVDPSNNNISKPEPLEPSLDKDRLIKHLIDNHDEWINDEDWWSSLDNYDLNVFSLETYGDIENECLFYKWQVSCYGLDKNADGEVEVNTGRELAQFYIIPGSHKNDLQLKEAI
jgi:hypothetical protein